MRCKYCGEEIREDYMYCLNCGKPTADSIKEYKENQNKKQETRSIEYFEIEQEKESNEEYDFSKFLYDNDQEELDEIEFSTEDDLKDENLQFENPKENREDLEKTQAIKFGRSDFKISDEVKKNKNKKDYRFQESKKKKPAKVKNKENKNFKEEPRQEDQPQQNYKRKSRFWKRIRNFVYNIFAGIGIWYLFQLIRFPVLNFVVDKFGVISLDDANSLKFASIIILIILIFLFLPFLICKGDAKAPLFFASLLISWTLIGWVILMVVAISSNLKFKKIY